MPDQVGHDKYFSSDQGHIRTGGDEFNDVPPFPGSR